METTLFSSNLFSHPEKPLEEHLINVCSISVNLLKTKKLNLDNYNIEKLIVITSLSHDIGKATSYFQRYLNKEKGISKDDRSHSLLSSICSYFACKESGLSDEEAFFSFIAVKNHHSDLKDLMENCIFLQEDNNILKKQLSSIDDNKFRILSEHLLNAGYPLKLNKSLISNWIDTIDNELRQFKRILRKRRLKENLDEEEIFDWYLKINFLFSLLIDADKLDAGVGKENLDKVLNKSISITSNAVDIYKNKKIILKDSSNNQINILRQKAYEEINSKDIDLNKKIYSVNLPTGLGKTLASFSFALKLREKFYNEYGIYPTIIYSLPFLSIIEQNYNVIENVLKSSDIDATTNIILKHHHLSDYIFSYSKNTEDIFDDDKAKLLIESWNSNIIITTFLQLFYTMLSNKNSALKKFHKLCNSIIIIDEVQAIPPRYWLLIKYILAELLEKFNSYIIFSTATEPLIFERDKLFYLNDRNKYFSSLNRVSLKVDIEKNKTLEQFANEIKIEKHKSYLIILNTIEQAKRFYEIFKNIYPDLDICFLSTHVIPKQRFERIEQIKEKRYQVVISTQLIEAGVDVDFDIVYRDLSPLDSINQSAGRCNRNANNQMGLMNIVSLVDDNGKLYAAKIYDSTLLDITKRILLQYEGNFIPENKFLEIIDRYYQETKLRGVFENSLDDGMESSSIIKSIFSLVYESDDQKTISDFKLIDDQFYKVDTFVCLDDFALSLWSEYERILSIEDRFERKNKFNKIKAEFYKYVISIPKTVTNLPPIVNNIPFVSQNQLKDYYDKNTGFITKGVLAIW